MRRKYTLAGLVATAAAAYAYFLGTYWVTDLALLAALGGVVMYFGWLGALSEDDVATAARMVVYLTGFGVSRVMMIATRRSKGGEERGRATRVRRSRIAHYVAVSRMKSTSFLSRESESPFERALLRTPGWKKLTAEGLAEVGRSVPLPARTDAAGR